MHKLKPNITTMHGPRHDSVTCHPLCVGFCYRLVLFCFELILEYVTTFTYHDDSRFGDGVVTPYREGLSRDPVIVAILDSGLDFAHPAFGDHVLYRNTFEIPGDGIDNDGNGWVDDYHGVDIVNGDGDPTDDSGHGTMVAGVMVADGSLDGVEGVEGILGGITRGYVKILVVKILDRDGEGSLVDYFRGLDYALSAGASVVLTAFNSLDPGVNDDVNKKAQDILGSVLKYSEMTVLHVAAAGNQVRQSSRSINSSV